MNVTKYAGDVIDCSIHLTSKKIKRSQIFKSRIVNASV